MTKIHIISGFLGAGKTTLIRYLLEGRANRGKLAIIENEFGQVGLDGLLLRTDDLPVREINSGCICCSLAGDFRQTIRRILDEYAPDEILIEPSGVGRLSEVCQSVLTLVAEERKRGLGHQGLRQLLQRKKSPSSSEVTKNTASPASSETHRLQIGAAVTVVDAQKYERYAQNFGEFYRDQIGAARDILVTRTEMLTDAQKVTCITYLRSLNKQARIHFRSLHSRTPEEWNSILLDGEPVVGGDPADCTGEPDPLCVGLRAHPIHKHSASLPAADSVAESVVQEKEKPSNTEDGRTKGRGNAGDSASNRGNSAGGKQWKSLPQQEAPEPAQEHFSSQAWRIEACSTATAEALRVALRAGAFGRVIRLKGVLPNENNPNEWIHVEYAGGEWQRGRLAPQTEPILLAIGTDWNPEGFETFFRAHDLVFERKQADQQEQV